MEFQAYSSVAPLCGEEPPNPVADMTFYEKQLYHRKLDRFTKCMNKGMQKHCAKEDCPERYYFQQKCQDLSDVLPNVGGFLPDKPFESSYLYQKCAFCTYRHPLDDDATGQCLTKHMLPEFVVEKAKRQQSMVVSTILNTPMRKVCSNYRRGPVFPTAEEAKEACQSNSSCIYDEHGCRVKKCYHHTDEKTCSANMCKWLKYEKNFEEVEQCTELLCSSYDDLYECGRDPQCIVNEAPGLPRISYATKHWSELQNRFYYKHAHTGKEAYHIPLSNLNIVLVASPSVKNVEREVFQLKEMLYDHESEKNRAALDKLWPRFKKSISMFEEQDREEKSNISSPYFTTSREVFCRLKTCKDMDNMGNIHNMSEYNVEDILSCTHTKLRTVDGRYYQCLQPDETCTAATCEKSIWFPPLECEQLYKDDIDTDNVCIAACEESYLISEKTCNALHHEQNATLKKCHWDADKCITARCSHNGSEEMCLKMNKRFNIKTNKWENLPNPKCLWDGASCNAFTCPDYLDLYKNEADVELMCNEDVHCTYKDSTCQPTPCQDMPVKTTDLFDPEESCRDHNCLWQKAENHTISHDNQYICLPKQTYSIVLHDRPGNLSTTNNQINYRDVALDDTLDTGTFGQNHTGTYLDVEFVQLDKTKRQLNYISLKQGNLLDIPTSIALACQRNDPIQWVAMCSGYNLSNDAAFELDGVNYPCFQKKPVYCYDDDEGGYGCTTTEEFERIMHKIDATCT